MAQLLTHINKFKTRLGHTVRHCLNKQTNNPKTKQRKQTKSRPAFLMACGNNSTIVVRLVRGGGTGREC